LTEIFETCLEKLPVMLTWVPEAIKVVLIEEVVSGCTGTGRGAKTVFGADGVGGGVGSYAATATTML